MQKIFHLLVWRSFYVSVDLSWRQSKYRENVSLSRAFQHIFTTAKFLNPIWHQWNCSWQILEGVQACQDCLSQERVSCFFHDVCTDPHCDPQHRQTRNDFDSEIRVNHSSTLAQLSSWFISYSSKYLRPELRRRIMVAWFVIIQLVVTLKLFCTSDWFIADDTEHLKLKMASLHRWRRIQLKLIWAVRDANQQSRMQQRKTLLHNLAMGTCLQISASQSRN